MRPEKGFAFVEFAERADAETAVKAAWNAVSIHGVKLRVDWSKAAPKPKPKPPAAPSSSAPKPMCKFCGSMRIIIIFFRLS